MCDGFLFSDCVFLGFFPSPGLAFLNQTAHTQKNKNIKTDEIPHLNTMVVRIGNDDTVCVGHGYVVRMFELAFLLATAAKLPDEGTVRLEYLPKEWD